ncbi:DUF559 domain-containing protein [Candidatus Uhrbacteria bacterium]|nr:DUF559 domain-containing protein [Candidatus Uhrbacteria bacterium]
MSSIRGKDTGLELLVFGELRKQKVYFRRHHKKVLGCPDVCVPGFKIAVFIDGDFWHGWRYPLWRHKMPNEFWRGKIEGNRARDRRNSAKLRKQGWKVMRVWEHQIKNNQEETIAKIVEFIRFNRRG